MFVPPDSELAIVQAEDVPGREAAWEEIAFGWETYNTIVASFKALALKNVLGIFFRPSLAVLMICETA